MRQKRDKDENLLSLPKNQSNQENYRRGGIRFLYYKNKLEAPLLQKNHWDG